MNSNNTSNTDLNLDWNVVDVYQNYGTGDGTFYWEHCLLQEKNNPANTIWVKTKIKISHED